MHAGFGLWVNCTADNTLPLCMQGLWVNYTADNTLYSGKSIPWYLGCTLGNLPGCLFLFDDVDAQCGPNRKGIPPDHVLQSSILLMYSMIFYSRNIDENLYMHGEHNL